MIRNVRLVEHDEQGQVAREVIIGKEEFLVGRGGDCDLRLAEEAVSRHHCLIRVIGDSADVSDLGSSNGTFLNGQRIISQAPLHTGDVLRIGPSQFDVDLGDRPTHEPNPTRVDPAARTWRIKNLPGL